MDNMRVWIGCLACYNNGDLTGKWYAATDAADITTERLHEDVGVFSPSDDADMPDAFRWVPPGKAPTVIFDADYGTHEELWVMDHDGFGGLLVGECSPMEAAQIAELVTDADLSDTELEALSHFRANYGSEITEELIDEFRDKYCGFWDSEQDYAQNLADDLGAVNENATWPNNYIDWERATRDLFLDGNWSADGHGGVHVFHD